MAARWATSAPAATWITPSPSAPWCSRATSTATRPAPASSPTACPRASTKRCWPRARPWCARSSSPGRACEAAPAADRQLRFLRSEEHTSELQSRLHLVCRLLLEKKKNNHNEILRHDEPVVDPYVWSFFTETRQRAHERIDLCLDVVDHQEGDSHADREYEPPGHS